MDEEITELQASTEAEHVSQWLLDFEEALRARDRAAL